MRRSSIAIGSAILLSAARSFAVTQVSNLSEPYTVGFTANGVKISLVSGSPSQRSDTGPNANRGWLRLTVPEPGAVAGAIAALAVLAVCHALARRRARRAVD
jgi:hypothetical protein